MLLLKHFWLDFRLPISSVKYYFCSETAGDPYKCTHASVTYTGVTSQGVHVLRLLPDSQTMETSGPSGTRVRYQFDRYTNNKTIRNYSLSFDHDWHIHYVLQIKWTECIFVTSDAELTFQWIIITPICACDVRTWQNLTSAKPRFAA